ncbi:MAG: hypothetical protein B7Z73_09565 [Planctomycetia bacterium 21-64-5]|nr:MAG: hypothetical protein B7Z73_09565 [Planctomycetia bacterium 21-64-5]
METARCARYPPVETLVGAARGVQRKARSAQRSPWKQNLPDRLARAAMLDTRPTARWKRATDASDRIEPSLGVDRQSFENRPQVRGHRTPLVRAILMTNGRAFPPKGRSMRRRNAVAGNLRCAGLQSPSP